MTSTEDQSTLLPIPLYKSPEQAERELIYRTLLDIRMSLDQIRGLLLDRINHSDLRPVQPPIQAEVSAEEPLSLKELEREHILKALDRHDGNRKLAAKALGIGERTLYRKLKEYGIEE
jgi:DNA-binding NtrC family response regulator